MLAASVKEGGEPSGPAVGRRVHEQSSLLLQDRSVLVPEIPGPDQASGDGCSEPVVTGALGYSRGEFGEGAHWWVCGCVCSRVCFPEVSV